MAFAAGGVARMGTLSPEGVAAWVVASCAAQGVPVKVTDAQVISRVRALLGRDGPGVQGSRRTPGAPGGPPGRSRLEAPDRGDPGGVERGAAPCRGDDGVVEDGSDDGGLAVEVEGRPLSA